MRIVRLATIRSQGLCCENTADDGGNIRLDPRQPKALANVRLLRAVCGDLRDYAMPELLVGTGLRVGTY
jgi:hypothetical protein